MQILQNPFPGVTSLEFDSEASLAVLRFENGETRTLRPVDQAGFDRLRDMLVQTVQLPSSDRETA